MRDERTPGKTGATARRHLIFCRPPELSYYLPFTNRSVACTFERDELFKGQEKASCLSKKSTSKRAKRIKPFSCFDKNLEMNFFWLLSSFDELCQQVIHTG